MGGFNDILYNIEPRSVLSISNKEAAFEQEVQMQPYPSFSLESILVQAIY